jgi:hypothetical protein
MKHIIVLFFNQNKLFHVSGRFPVYFVANRVRQGLLEDSLIEELARRNVHFMRPFGISKTAEGLRFAFVSGIELSEEEERDRDGDSIRMTKRDLEYVEEQYMKSGDNDKDEGLIDVLFAWSWPQELIEYSNGNSSIPESMLLGPLLWHVKPRYVFVPAHDSTRQVERIPFENVDMKTGEFLHCTRFIALAGASDGLADASRKTKWIYALNLQPSKTGTLPSQRPDECSSNPFLPVSMKKTTTIKGTATTTSAPTNFFFQSVTSEVGSKRRFEASDPAFKRPPPGYVCKKCHSGDHFFRDCIYKDSHLSQNTKSTYVCHICHEPGHHIKNCPKRDEQRTPSASKTVSPDSCWFCLSNPAARKHLIVDIGDEAYVALAKGPLTADHIIIVPIEHVSSTTSMSSLSEPLSAEIINFMHWANTLQPGKQSIFFRLASNPSHHMHIQGISIDSSKIGSFLEFLTAFSAKFGFKFEKPEPANSLQAFFEFSYISGESEKGEICKLAHFFDVDAFFPAQFGRQVLAEFLEIDGGADWKNQIYTEDDERKFVSHLKSLNNKSK